MGIVSSLQAQSNIVMKILLVLVVAAYAKAEAEADPGFVYSTGALPLAPALTYAYNPVVYTVPAAGCQTVKVLLFPVLKVTTSDTFPLLLPLPLLLLQLLKKLRERRERLRLSQKLKLTQKLTLGYTTAVSMDMVMDMAMLH